MEKQGFRATMAQLNERFPEHEMLTISDVMAFTGLSRTTIWRRIRLHPKLKRVAKADLARQICIGGTW